MAASRKTVLTILFAAGLGLSLAACGGKPLQAAEDAMEARDLAKAELALAAVLKERPDLRLGHMESFVLFRYQQIQGEAAQQDVYRHRALAEYDWLVHSYQLAANYQDMEGSIRLKEDAAADFAEAHKHLYGI